MSAALDVIGAFEEDVPLTLLQPTFSEKDKDDDLVAKAFEALPDLELFHTLEGVAYATFTVNSRAVTNPIDSSGFRQRLNYTFHKTFDTWLGSRTLNELVEQLSAVAICEGLERLLYTRVGEHDGAIYIDLADTTGEVIRVTKAGYDFCVTAECRFEQSGRRGALPRPTQGGSVNELRPFVNVASDEDFRLLVGFILGCLRPKGPFPVLLVDGPQGSAKSTLTRVIKKLVDPGLPEMRRLTGKDEDIVIGAKHTWLLAYDNLSGLRGAQSDSICALATGAGHATRKFFTETGEVFIQVTRPVILNGIDSIAERGDLVDRGIHLELVEIDPSKRLDEETFWADFEESRPRILGALLNAASVALANVAATKLSRAPRMADFARWVTAAEPALGIAPGGFLAAYERNRMQSTLDVAGADNVALAMGRFVSAHMRANQKLQLDTTAAELLERLNRAGPDTVVNAKDWPKQPNRLSDRLRRAHSTLRNMGIEIESLRVGAKGTRILRIKIEPLSLPPTSRAALAPVIRLPLPTRGTDGGPDDALTIARPAASEDVSSSGSEEHEPLADGADDADDDSEATGP